VASHDDSTPHSHHQTIAPTAGSIVPPLLVHYNGAIVSENAHARPDDVTSDNTSLFAHPNEISFYPTALCSSFDMLDDISSSDVPGSGIPLPDNSLLRSTPSFTREYHSLPDFLRADNNESPLDTTTTTTAGNNNNNNGTTPKRPAQPRHHQHGHRSSSPTGQSDCTSLPDLYLRRESGLSIMREAVQALQAMDDDFDHLINDDPWSAGPAAGSSTAATGAVLSSAQEQQDNDHMAEYNNASTIDPIPLQQVFRGGD
jgi:hypothetical protein